MHMFGIISLFAAFSAMAHAAAIPLTPTPTQSECANEQSAIAHLHDLTEQIQSKLVEMQGMSEGQMPDNNLVVPLNDARNLAGTILEMTKASNEGAVVSIAATRVVREVTVDNSGLAWLFRKAADAPGPVQTCSSEKVVLNHVQNLAGQLQDKLVLMQNFSGPSILQPVQQLLDDINGLLLQLLNSLEGILGNFSDSLAGGPSGVGIGVAGGAAKEILGNVAGGVASGVVGTGTGAASDAAGGVLGVISGESARSVVDVTAERKLT